MLITRRMTVALLAGSVASLSVGPAFAGGATVNVSLWDKGEGSMDKLGEVTPMGLAMPGADLSKATMGITPETTTIPAGEITFRATNDSKDTIHEMVLAPVADLSKPLPYDADAERVIEDEAGHLGEVEELDPGQSGSLTVHLEPGTYILYCNIPGHYILGMWSLINVTA